MGVRARVSEDRRRMRGQGYRPIQIWVPDVRAQGFSAEAHRQAAAVAAAERDSDDQAFIEAVSAPWDEE
ncbi:antitoxin MazE family protein [Arthrobacter sp. I2-34]|uniref:Antitoxin MazE family protein n=1 Tax=Arthrobacter hankyongi TaxID=2904801 RepID=A0ABS9L5K0_9MICC|nr:antitoxin MazE family protein [Arthrobacter hankyongi]MCG2621813.1 antitoxin MazE family protein [Arthrobacter hankyongi]